MIIADRIAAFDGTLALDDARFKQHALGDGGLATSGMPE